MANSIALALSAADHGSLGIYRLLSYVLFPSAYPRNLFLLGLLVLLNHLVAVGELACAIWINSLGLFSHGSHMIFNGVILTGLLASVLANWEEHKRYSLRYIDLVARLNLAVGCVLLFNAAVVGFMSFRDAGERPIVRCESLVYLVPIPALLLNLVAIYVILYGHEEEEEEEKVAGQVPPERRADERRTSEYVRQHLMANALGSVGTITSTICVQLLNWVIADTLCSGFVVGLMFVCATLLIREALEMSQAAQPRPAVTPDTQSSALSNISSP